MATDHTVVKRVLVIAGSDSSGGAGMQRDLAVLASQDVAVGCAVTAVTAQSSDEVSCIHYVPSEVVGEQITMAIQEPIDAIKIGMLGTRACVEVVARALGRCPGVPIVLDPVLVSTSGRRLLEPGALQTLCGRLAPLATLVTPNLAEAALLLGTAAATNEEQRTAQALELANQLGSAILLKGGHAGSAFAIDLLAEVGRDVVALSSPRLDATMRGTGCALSSLIAAGLAHGLCLEDACKYGKQEVFALLQR